MPAMTFSVPQMDCPAEEQLIRLALADLPEVRHLAFDLPQRRLLIACEGDGQRILPALHRLNLGAVLLAADDGPAPATATPADPAPQRAALRLVLGINATLFVAELAAGLLARSLGLVADALDMLADAFVYGLSLYAVGRAVARQRQIARLSGYLQLGLALPGLVEVLRRFLGLEAAPDFALMVGMSLIALAGNVATLLILQPQRRGPVHLQASWIFTTSDVLVNISIIVAGVLVLLTASPIPDLLVGGAVFCLVAVNAGRILRLAARPTPPG
ncbi:MAG: cation transporter [Anaerolineae bacterium]|nr:cation transporter [Anaerolineae bacterium]